MTADRDIVRLACRECPFRRASAAGYLGECSHDPHEFVDLHWHTDLPLPCHMAVDWENPDAQEIAMEAALCRGFLILLHNSCKLPHNRDLADAVRSMEPDHERFFSRLDEFCEHHILEEQPCR